MNKFKHLLLLAIILTSQAFGGTAFLEKKDSDEVKSQMIDILNMQENPNFEFVENFERKMSHITVGRDEAAVINDLLPLLASDPSFLQKVLQGAHVRINDNGNLYFQWSDLEAARERISSHPSLPDSKQYGIIGPVAHEILFGIVEVDNQILTFFQFENTPWDRSIENIVWHTMDAIQYLITSKNIGPYGRSEHTDKNPIKL